MSPVTLSVKVREGEHVILFYTSKVDKMRIFSSYILEGVTEGDRVIYVYPDGEDVRGELRRCGINVEEYEREGSLLLMTLSQVYLFDGVFDKSKCLNLWAEIKTDAMRKGYKHQRDLIDVGNLSFLKGQEEKYFEYLREAIEQFLDQNLIELRAVNTENLDKRYIREFKSFDTRRRDLSRYRDAFSKRIGSNHQRMIGRKILLEFDPVLRYEKTIEDFIVEAIANHEQIAVFTTRGSTIHTSLKEKRGVKFFYLTKQVSAPKQLSESEMLIPSRDTSLMLDVFDKTLKAHPHGIINLVFDSLSDLVLSIGFDKTYHFVRYVTEMLEPSRVTALFLLNRNAHDLKVVSTLRSLFGNQVSLGKGGIEAVKFPQAEAGTLRLRKILTKEGR